jgi:hypothetical protein
MTLTHPSRHPFRDKRMPVGNYRTVIVAGDPTFFDWDRAERVLDRVTFFIDLVRVAAGGTSGAAGLGVRWAHKWWWPYSVYESDFEAVRENPGGRLVVFWDGREQSTRHLLSRLGATLKPSRIKVVRY